MCNMKQYTIFMFFLLIFISFGLIKVNLVFPKSIGAEKYYNYAMRLKKNGDVMKAESVFRKGLKKYPNSLKLNYFRAKLLHHDLGRHAEAIRGYTRVIKLNPKYNPKAFWRRGECLYYLNNFQMAIKDYNNCLRLIPNYDRVYYLRAKAYAKLGLYRLAENDLKYLIKNHPKFSNSAKLLYKSIRSGQFK